jgi:hypothetical protein
MSSGEEQKSEPVEKIKRKHDEEPKRSEDEPERTDDETRNHEPREGEGDKE